jgi:hypothetical protein
MSARWGFDRPRRALQYPLIRFDFPGLNCSPTTLVTLVLAGVLAAFAGLCSGRYRPLLTLVLAGVLAADDVVLR